MYFVITQPDSTLFSNATIFSTSFSHTKNWEGSKESQCLSWSHVVAVKVAIITRFGQGVSSRPDREGRLWVSNDITSWGVVHCTSVCSSGLPTHSCYCQTAGKSAGRTHENKLCVYIFSKSINTQKIRRFVCTPLCFFFKWYVIYYDEPQTDHTVYIEWWH